MIYSRENRPIYKCSVSAVLLVCLQWCNEYCCFVAGLNLHDEEGDTPSTLTFVMEGLFRCFTFTSCQA